MILLQNAQMHKKIFLPQMVWKRIVFAVAIFSLLVGMVLVLTSCSSAFATHPSETHTVIDSMGREVEVPVEVDRIAALDSFSGEAVVMIGAGEQLCSAPAGVTSDLLLCEVYPELASVSVPMSGGTFNVETLAQADPDVVLIKETLYHADGEVEKLHKLGLPYLVIGYSNMEEQIDAIRMIGQVCGGEGENRAEALCSYYQQTIDLVKACARTIPDEEKLTLYHSINEIVRTDGERSLGADWTTCVGVINVSAREQIEWGETDYNASLEQIYAWDPDVVVCNSAGTVQYLYSDSKWTGLRAVREGTVYNIPVGATRWGQRGSVETFFAMLWLGQTIYPQYYTNIDLKHEVIQFYKDYLGLSIDDEMYEKMLAGKELRTTSTVSAETGGI